MADPWLSIIGLNEDGLAGLSSDSRAALDRAEAIFGGPRHLELVAAGARGRPWPVPFSVDPVLEWRGRPVVVLASGDPFWFGAGGSLLPHLAKGDWRSFPAPSTFALAANHLGWRLESLRCFGLHAAPFERLLPALHRGAKVLCLLRDGQSPAELAAWLCQRGGGETRLHVLERLGGPRQRCRSTKADGFALTDITAPVTVGLEVATAIGLPATPGLPDDAFAHDGQITKRPVRALTLCALSPRPEEVLWDIGAGSGSISVEWCLAGGRAVAMEAKPARVTNIRENIARFGLGQQMQVICAEVAAPALPADLPPPDAVFIGGGGSEALVQSLFDRLPTGTRLVMNGVTLETEMLLAKWHAAKGGTLLRVELANAAPLGGMRGWVPARPVVQWSVVL
ncbi:precorrin-6y C5,15-methyltransferase (decarboxylating) subunit CbiE [Pseudorhodobacter sp. E13]|uniref:precorrin-6y C5,15-methyltransferase (decarboxylating) subunit CbiE n=1 Tax=Pseudorhodobacter sp. E13 TaxID=2487931 RepID=UPI000F8CBF89|nr:precorrin-6y C5,15-methyltransferase (decarboxylating) subunit CbiE [Pseudorhodobacter sp. E13]RUS63359.1 precorrin-6y C5,15-methyltransferase (decarboxylating) subunit CbiE [Pseudorhodobacter sp. E13]